MKKILVYLFFLVPQFVFSQNFSANRNAIDSTTVCYITTIDNTKLKGRLLAESTEQVTVIDITFGEISISRKKIKDFHKELPNSLFEVRMVNDNTVRGKIVSISKEKWVVNTISLGKVDIKTADILDFYVIDESELNAEGDLINIDPGRYFVGPTPFSLNKKRTIFQNTELLINGVSYGLGSNFSITAGLVYIYLPYVNIKYAAKITHNLHFSVGAMAGGYPFYSSGLDGIPMGGAGYAQVGVGDMENHFSVGVFYPYYGTLFFEGQGFTDQFSFSVGGVKRLTDNISIMVEDYVIQYPDAVSYYYSNSTTYVVKYLNAGAAGVRMFMKKRKGGGSWALSTGMAWITNSNLGRNSLVVFPIIGFSFPLVPKGKSAR